MAKLIKADGTEQEVYPSDKENGFSLEELYKMIECNVIEPIKFSHNMYIIVDEEASLKENQILNETAMSYFYGCDVIILGNVVICNDKEFQ